MSKIFVSYRRDDTAGHAGRLYDRLAERFGKQQLFRDVDQIHLGEDFVDAIERGVASCKVLLAIIGPRWLQAQDKRGKRRLDDPRDFVRLEIATALSRQVPVIPVLVGGGGMPDPDELPDVLAALTRRQALEVSETRFDYDVGRLIEALEQIFAVPDASVSKPSAVSAPEPAPAVPADEPPAINVRHEPGALIAELEVIDLPDPVREKLACHTPQLQLRFLDIYARQRRKLPIAYSLLVLPAPILGLHNSYLGLGRRQLIYVAVCMTLASAPLLGLGGWIFLAAAHAWPVVDLFLLPGMVRERNADIAKMLVLDQGEADPR